jgi:hypothetical protein
MSFSDTLREAKKKKDAEIDRICSRHYADFLNSVNEMLRMQSSTNNLRQSLQSVHDQFNTTGQQLITVLDKLDAIQVERDNTRKLLECCLLSKEITKYMVKVNEYIAKDNHYSAMRTIELIQQESKRISSMTASNGLGDAVSNRTATHTQHLPGSMLKLLDRWLPVAINKLLYAVRGEADTLLNHLRNHINIIGQSILYRQVMISSGNIEETKSMVINHIINHHLSGNNMITTSTLNNPKQIDELLNTFFPTKLSISMKYILTQLALFQISNRWNRLPINMNNCLSYHFSTTLAPKDIAMGTDILDYRISEIGPLHKVLHLYAVLGKLNNYHSYYELNRNEVLVKIWKTFEKNINAYGLLKSVSSFFEELMGFFTVECMISKMIELPLDTFSHEELESLWFQSIDKFQSLLTQMAITLSSCDELIQIKEEILLVIHIASDEMFGFSVLPLLQVLSTLWEIFDALQIQSMTRSILSALDKSAYQPFYVSSYDIYCNQIRSYALELIEINQENQATRSMPSNGNMDGNSHGDHRQSSNDRGASVMTLTHLEANLDALEEEIVTNIPALSPTNNINQQQQQFISSGNMGSGGLNTNMNEVVPSNFIAQTYPFSEFVPAMMKEIHSSIIRLFLYSIVKLPTMDRKNHGDADRRDMLSSNNGKSQGPWDELVCKSVVNTYMVIVDVLSQELRRDGNETALSKACQIYIDSSVLALASESLWTIVENALGHFSSYDFYMYTHTDSNTSTTQALSSTSSYLKSNAVHQQQQHQDKIHKTIQIASQQVLSKLRQLTSQAQDLIFELLAHKILDLLESLVFINFAPDALLSTSGNPSNGNMVNLQNANTQFVHETIESIIEFLTITFMWLTHLPLYLREAIYFTSCSQLASGIISHLLSTKVVAINVYGLIALDADCKRLLSFADSCGVQSLKQCFCELHELVQCLLSHDLPAYVENPNARQRVFPHIGAAKLAILLDKVRNRSIFDLALYSIKDDTFHFIQVTLSPIQAMASNLPRFEKNPTKALVKKLRQQASQSS